MENTDQPQSFTTRVTRFLSTASQTALNVSAVISNQICHNIHPTRSLSTVPRSHSIVSSTSGTQLSKSVRTKSYSDSTKTQTESQLSEVLGFENFLLCQGPRGLDIGTEEEYREHYANEISWRQDMGALDVEGEHLSPKSTHVTQTHRVFERSVEKRVGAEELRPYWLEYCNKHGSRGGHQSSQPSHSVLLPPCDLSTVEEDNFENSSAYSSARGLPQPIEPSELPPFAIQINDTGNILDDASSLGSPNPRSSTTLSSSALSSSTLSSAPSYLGTPSIHGDNLLRSPISPSPEPYFRFTEMRVQEKKTNYFALYPSDHRLGFNCVCEACKLKQIKKLKPHSIPTLAERRTERRTAKRAAMDSPPTPTTPEESNYTFSGCESPVAPSGYFMSGNTRVPAYNYKEKLCNVAPDTYMLGNHIVYSVGSSGKAKPNRKRVRNTETSLTEDEGAFEEEHSESKRRRRK